VPVFTNGEWSGTVGFVDIEGRTDWSAEAVRMLEVTAPMLGNFWEREMTRRRLEELVQSKDRFVATVSHELRTPLSAVLGFAEELANHSTTFEPHEATEILELIADQSRDMADMVEDLLVAARADLGTVSIHPDEVYLRSQAEAALVAIGSTGPTTVVVVGGPGRAWADPARSRQIIRNLLTNAVRYGGSQVIIEASCDETTTVLTVSDDGVGLDETEWERIFEPYERAHDRPTQPASIGLGLTVSRQLARMMGGDLVYRSDESGSTFELTLPANPEMNVEPLSGVGSSLSSGR
jgi:signal transduction histidine kinase